ncbi:MAG: hypothetical protein QG670_2643 [Thermoproteota archaeon]|nr:hypothetical protein [Thermoproteota archaeon]
MFHECAWKESYLSHPVVIVDYNPKWPVIFEEEKKRILEAAGCKIRAIQHIGSTAVPGLGAKPIVDMMAGVDSSTDADECLSLLCPIGYTDITPEPGNTDWYHCLGKRDLDNMTYLHLHLMRFLSYDWGRHLLFRDFLRSHNDVAIQYFELKKSLAAKYGADRVGYTNAKTSFIESVVALARFQGMLPQF